MIVTFSDKSAPVDRVDTTASLLLALPTIYHTRNECHTETPYGRMLAMPDQLLRSYGAGLDRSGVSVKHRTHYKKWLRYYLDFCHKYGFDATLSSRFPPFGEKLREKNQADWSRKRADEEVSLYCEVIAAKGRRTAVHGSRKGARPRPDRRQVEGRGSRFPLSAMDCRPGPQSFSGNL